MIKIDSTSNTQSTKKKTAWTLAVVAVLMFGFAFAMVPLYRLVCDVAGINNIDANSGRQSIGQSTPATESSKARTITVQFDATINGKLNWEFYPEHKTLEVTLGQPVTTHYILNNQLDHSVTTQSIPGVTPWQGNQYLKKIECFCFSNQTLNAHEKKKMSLQFVISPELPEDISVLTLSYTIMNLERSDALKPDKSKLPSLKHTDHEGHDHSHHSPQAKVSELPNPTSALIKHKAVSSITTDDKKRGYL